MHIKYKHFEICVFYFHFSHTHFHILDLGVRLRVVHGYSSTMKWFEDHCSYLIISEIISILGVNISTIGNKKQLIPVQVEHTQIRLEDGRMLQVWIIFSLFQLLLSLLFTKLSLGSYCKKCVQKIRWKFWKGIENSKPNEVVFPNFSTKLESILWRKYNIWYFYN